jgi:hypothetical protein
MTAANVTQWILALFGGGGAALLGREIARQIGETRRTRIREEEQTRRLTIEHVMPLPDETSRPKKRRTLDAA